MPYTEEQVTSLAAKLGEPVEVVTKFLAQDEKSPEVIALFDKLSKSTFIKEEDFATRIANEKKIAEEAASGVATGMAYGAMDKRIAKVTGIEKREGEKTADYLDRVIQEKLSGGAKPSEELERLRSEISAKDRLLAEKETELSTIKNTYDSERTTLTINSKLDAVINALPIDAKEEMLDSQREFLKYRLGQSYKIDLVEGKLQFTDKSTNQIVRDNVRADIMNEKQLIESFAPKVVSLKQSSSGKRGAGLKDTPLNDDPATVQYSQYNSIEELKDHMNKSGIGLVGQKANEILSGYITWKAGQK